MKSQPRVMPSSAHAQAATVLSTLCDDERLRLQTMQHLRDILDVHGIGKRWPTLAIPEGRPVRIEAPEPFASPCGSTAALCAAEGDPALP